MLPIWLFAFRLGLALTLGCLIGLERQWHQRMAGTRTNGLVALGAAAFMMAAQYVAIGSGGSPRLVADESGIPRVLGQVISGIGFLGAGVIFKEGANVRGLNTAATVWCSAAVGALSGLGHLLESLILAGFVLFTNLTLRPLAYKFRPVGEETFYQINITCERYLLDEVRALLYRFIRELHASIQSFDANVEGRSTRISAVIMTHGRNDTCIEKVVKRLLNLLEIQHITWQLLTSRHNDEGTIQKSPDRNAA